MIRLRVSTAASQLGGEGFAAQTQQVGPTHKTHNSNKDQQQQPTQTPTRPLAHTHMPHEPACCAVCSKHNDNTWTVPGGNVEAADSSLLGTATREAMEELGGVPPFEIRTQILTKYVVACEALGCLWKNLPHCQSAPDLTLLLPHLTAPARCLPAPFCVHNT